MAKPVKRIEFKLFGSDNKQYEIMRFRAPKGGYIGPAERQDCMHSIIAGLNDKWPHVSFYIVKVSPTQYNIFHRESVGNA